MGVDIMENKITISVNPKIYPLEVIYSAAYVLLDRAYVFLDGDPEKEVKVELKAKKEGYLGKLEEDFKNELLNYAVYKKQSEKNSEIRQAIIQRALITNGFDMGTEEDFAEDPEGIAIPWEEKYGKEDES